MHPALYRGFWLNAALLTPLTVALAQPESLPEPEAEDALQGEIDPDTGIRLRDGFRATVVADLGTEARHIAVRDNGDIYVNSRAEGEGIYALRDENGDGVADTIENFDSIGGTGIQIHDGYLYASDTERVYRYPLVDGELLPAVRQREIVVGGFPAQDQHASKAFVIDGEGNLHVNVGAPSNACQQATRTPGSPGMEPCPQRERQAGIWRFDANRLEQTQQADGERVAAGVRNTVALDWHPGSGDVYLVQHGRDQLHEFWPERYSARDSALLPAEEFHRIRGDGIDAGWPYTYWDQLRGERMRTPEYGGDGETPAQDDYAEPILGFPGHWAPNDLVFYTADAFPERYKNGAFIAFHGSWNRGPYAQAGYKVVFVPFEDGMPAGEGWEEFADGFPGKFEIESFNDARYRAMGVAVGPQGELYITDSNEGRVWRIEPTAE